MKATEFVVRMGSMAAFFFSCFCFEGELEGGGRRERWEAGRKGGKRERQRHYELVITPSSTYYLGVASDTQASNCNQRYFLYKLSSWIL